MSPKAIQERARFDAIRYANCWEDPTMLLRAADLRDKRCLSIASGGDNSFSLLTASPREVVAFDLSPVQLAVCELKAAAFRNLEYGEFLSFLGFTPSARDRADIYRDKLRGELASDYFDHNLGLIRGGVIHAGKFERYFRIFRRFVLPFAHSRRTVAELLREKSAEERRRFYRETWDSPAFRGIYRVFFNRWVMGRLGRDPEFFRYVDAKLISGMLKRQTDYALAELPTHDNPYLHYIMTSDFAPALPHYARREHFDAIRSNLGRIRFVKGTPDELAGEYDSAFDFFNLSDIFEYMDEALCRKCADSIFRLAAPGATVAYFNMLVPRSLAELAPDKFAAHDDEAAAIFADNRAFFYRAYRLDTVKKEALQ
ncbi:MAG: DUF3419 family protein [Lentisphaeria bacterium]|nr:DUF3419 family protein [Lentisphaeria bacterium]